MPFLLRFKLKDKIIFYDGAPATRESFLQAAETVLRDARGYGQNDFKIELARRGIVRALAQAARGTPQSQAEKRINSGGAL